MAEFVTSSRIPMSNNADGDLPPTRITIIVNEGDDSWEVHAPLLYGNIDLTQMYEIGYDYDDWTLEKTKPYTYANGRKVAIEFESGSGVVVLKKREDDHGIAITKSLIDALRALVYDDPGIYDAAKAIIAEADAVSAY